MVCAGLRPYSSYQLRAACFNNMGSAASNWTTVTTLSEGTTSTLTPPQVLSNTPLPPAPQYASPFSVDSNLTAIWLDWTASFAVNGYLREFSVTESQLRVYTGFYSHLQIPRTSQKSETHTHPAPFGDLLKRITSAFNMWRPPSVRRTGC